MKKKIVSALLTATMVCGMSVVPAVGVAAADDTITVGFSQVGAESDWRTANTESMKSTFSEENGYELIFDDAQQKQENQLTAIRNFIQQEVDYILLAPVTETGWDTVLQEAKDADIPVIIVDRMVDVSDDSLYTTWIGTDSLLEGRKAAEWLNAYTTAKGIDAKDVNIVDIQGTIGSTAQIGRSKGLEEGVLPNGNACAAKPVVMCGDFNVAHQEIDLKNPRTNRGNPGFSDEEREKFTKLLDAGFVDTFRALHPETTGAYSWWSYRFNARANNAGWRIDYFLVSEVLREQVQMANIYSEIFGSDHCPVSLELDI